MRRKKIRIQDFDYSQNGAYFITICTCDKKNYFWDHPVGVSSARPNEYQEYTLNNYGKIVEYAIKKISDIYKNSVIVDNYVIMPNHIHIILILQNDTIGYDGRPMVAPTISRIVQQMKGYVTKQIGKSIWQKLFYEHIIRNEKDYKKIYEYIDNNPIRWELDKYYIT